MPNRKRSLTAFSLALVVAVAVSACDNLPTTPPAPVSRIKGKSLNLDTASVCPYGWIVSNGVLICSPE